MLLGCIADDFTGATDLCNTLVRHGMRTVQLIGVPETNLDPGEVDTVVIALKSRTIPAHSAIEQSLAALAWLQSRGAHQFFFKYCSTFDSTPRGNIGPVADALLDALSSNFTIACPAFPETGRTIFKGYLFVGDQLLNESGMADHPLTPMTDANLVRVLQAQTASPVGLVQNATVSAGPGAISEAFQALRQTGHRFAVVDAIDDAQLEVIGQACQDLALVTGGSGVALGLPANFVRAGLLPRDVPVDRLPIIDGRAAVLAGSCSTATLGQVEAMRQQRPSFKINPLALAAGEPVVEQALALADAELDSGPILVYATASPEEVRNMQSELGREEAGTMVETAMASIARGLVDRGVRRLVVAGGETSGAVVNELQVAGLRIGPQIDPGVPWTATLGDPPLALALKSGNFGTPDFFLKALSQLHG